MKVVFTSIVGDLFHIGHLKLLERAASFGEKLYVGVIDDETVYAYKGRRPIFPLRERLRIVKALKFVEDVLIQNTRDGSENILKLGKVDYVVRGDDAILEKEKKLIESMGGQYILLKRTPGISTTEIINKIAVKYKTD